MNCKDVQIELIAYLDEELSTMGQKAIKAHLAECEDCSKEVEKLRNVTKLTKRWQGINPKECWLENLQAKLETEKTKDLATEIHYLRNTISDLFEHLQQWDASVRVFNEIMTLDEVADYLRVDVDTLWNMLDELPHFQLGYELRFKKSSIDEWIKFKENRTELVDEQWFSGNDWFGQIHNIRRRKINENRNS